MNFNLDATIEKLVASGEAKNGPWYLYRVKEQDGKYSKSWTVFTNIQLGIGDYYELKGKISESPNKKFKNDAGKHPYQTTFNVLQSKLLSVGNTNKFDDQEPPLINQDDEIPF
ncbi:MAG TPA: hypothetical protein V6C58_24645 [Allocoleopsis sp.]